MSWPYNRYQAWPTAMDQHLFLTPHQHLMAWINHTSAENANHGWEYIERLPFSDAELESAMNRALELYTKWLAEDTRRLWPLLRNIRVGQAALNILRDAGLNLKGYAEDSGLAGVGVLTIIPRLCEARWHLRSSADRLERAAAEARI